MNALRWLLLGLSLVLLATLGARLANVRPPDPPTVVARQPPPAPVTPSLTRPGNPTPEAARAALELALRAAPDLSRAFEALRQNFPAVADRNLAAAADKLSRTGESTSPDDLLAGALHDLRQDSGVLAARASPVALGAIFSTKSDLLSALAQGDPRVCADYLFGATSPEYADFAATHRDLEAEAGLASVAATAEGRTLKVDRDAPTSDDFKAVETGLAAKGLSPDEIAALLDGKSLDPPLPDAKLCANARTYLDVLRALPDDVRLRLYATTAEALARS